ncbi:MAG: hypothetical protein HRT44_11330 [Bdellovibrionales bacterium]|nr:DUF4156 domain-containing protein [Bdellovibrionales bacterium]NQZ19833.1 hypothetical protein [Bdellovibrionales bacterium]
MKWWILSLVILIGGCRTPYGGNVSVGNSVPRGNCREVGQVIGTANTRDDPYEKALRDLKYEAAIIDGNFVRILAVAAHGASIRGMAYRCR